MTVPKEPTPLTPEELADAISLMDLTEAMLENQCENVDAKFLNLRERLRLHLAWARFMHGTELKGLQSNG